MTNIQNAITGTTQQYNKLYDAAGKMVINAKIKQGADYILLEDIYTTLGAETETEKNGIRWSVRRAKEAKVLANVAGYRGLYQVVRTTTQG